ncbi:DNA-directed RNA polymerases II and IV subunit 5A-like isoform X2 [Tripterygium wilfordii]|uniref:DNA-directed RNA polymerases II and IV subunit 5A-like isoform X2 n=1 Tax=Tripterygium wilfordii TaxID=458696 RepID=UPI0018F86395|nr:DNA-directed RNA polymerases II and IV subunit 5A-like isoform X2 [Tripterygium wilfordii]
MTLSEDEINTLSRIRRTIMKMLKDRGYLVADFEINMTKEEFISKFGENVKREDLAFAKAKTNDSSDQIHVFFPEEPKVGVTMIKNYAKRIIEENFSRAIMVVQQKLTQAAVESMDKFSRVLHLEVFKEYELLVNVAEHVLVPDHQVLTAEEKKTLLDSCLVFRCVIQLLDIMG